MTWPILSYFLAGHFALFFSKQKLSSGQGRSRAECSLLQQLVVSWKELCVIDENWSNTLLFFVVNFTVLFLNLHVHLPAALHLAIIFLLSRWMNREQTGFSSILVKGRLFSDQVSSTSSTGLGIQLILQHQSEQSPSQFCFLSCQKLIYKKTT